MVSFLSIVSPVRAIKMNVLLLTLVNLNDIDGNNVYQATLREFAKHGHRVYLVSPTEKRNNENMMLLTR